MRATRLFKHMDTEGTGHLTYQQLESGMHHNYPQSNVYVLIKTMKEAVLENLYLGGTIGIEVLIPSPVKTLTSTLKPYTASSYCTINRVALPLRICIFGLLPAAAWHRPPERCCLHTHGRSLSCGMRRASLALAPPGGEAIGLCFPFSSSSKPYKILLIILCLPQHPLLLTHPMPRFRIHHPSPDKPHVCTSSGQNPLTMAPRS